MSEIPVNAKDGETTKDTDVLLIHNPVPRSRIRWLEVSTTESHIRYVVDSETTIFCPINGKVTKIERNASDSFYNVEIVGDVARCTIVGADTLFVNEGEYLQAGRRLGMLKEFKPFETKDIYFTIACQFAGLNLHSVLRIR